MILKKKKILCLFAGYDQDGLIHDYVLYYLSEMAKIADVCYWADCELQKGELDKLQPYVRRSWAHRHGKYDFGSWQEMFHTIGWEECASYEHVILCNDSCYGPFVPLEPLIESMNARGCDFWGLTESFEICRHLQSYFLCFSQQVVSNEMFRRFFGNIAPQKSFCEVVLSYELTLTQLLESEYFSYDALIRGNVTGNWMPFPQTLFLKHEFPFVKVKCFTRPNGNLLEDAGKFLEEKVESSLGYPGDIIRKHLTVRSPHWKNELTRHYQTFDKTKERYGASPPTLHSPKLLVHLHLYYHEQTSYFVSKLRNVFRVLPFTLVVTFVTYNAFSESLVKREFPKAEFIQVENRGDDAVPFIKVLQHIENLSQYDLVLKLHTKEFYPYSTLLNDIQLSAYDWRNALVEPLIGSADCFLQNMISLLRDPSAGMIGSDNYILDFYSDFKANIREDDFYKICRDMFDIKEITPFFYVSGTMFLSKMGLLSGLREVDLSLFSKSLYKGKLEASLSHHIERLFGLLVYRAQYKIKGCGYAAHVYHPSLFMEESRENFVYKLSRTKILMRVLLLKLCCVLRIFDKKTLRRKLFHYFKK